MSYVPSLLNALMYSFVKLSILSIIIYQIGFFKGCLIFFITTRAYTFIMKHLFKYERFSTIDALLVNEPHSVFNMNVGAVFTVESLSNVENIKNSIISKLFKKVPKLSSKVVFLLGEYFFDCSKHPQYKEEDYLKQFKELELSRSEIKSYYENELSKHMNIFDNFGIEFHLIKFKNDNKMSDCEIDKNANGVIFMKINHMLSDGLGVVNLIGFMDDHYSVNKFPRFLKREKHGFLNNFIQEIYLTFLAFTYGFSVFKRSY